MHVSTICPHSVTNYKTLVDKNDFFAFSVFCSAEKKFLFATFEYELLYFLYVEIKITFFS